ncbi:MAG TPA: DHH family phosphoesterase [Solirubrobacterales bacterium]|nr:DHH family phosphoesterase [Solirubrobacterales bacterium]
MSEATAAVGRSAGREQIAAILREGDRFLLTTHEGPDGDALGSLLGLHHLLEGLGKDSIMFLGAKEFPLPIEYRFLPLAEVFHELPADFSDRVVIFLDCGNLDRAATELAEPRGNRTLNIDHHHDNTMFAEFNLVDDSSSCTAEIVYELAGLLGAEITPKMASALYVGIVTDTGKFMYDNTSAGTHRVVADLIEAGVDVDDIYRRLYEHVPIEKLRLIARALNGVDILCRGRLAVSYMTDDDYAVTGADESMTEGIIDHLRSIEGTRVAALIRDLGARGNAARKISLRSTGDEVDVSVIARAQGGGGHRRAAGFSTDLPYREITRTVGDGLEAQLDSE